MGIGDWSRNNRRDVHDALININYLFLGMSNHLKNELHNIISGKSQVSHGAAIQAITGYLDDGTQPSFEVEKSKQVREEETKKLINFITEQNLWIGEIDFSQYVSEGAEQQPTNY
jgi:hypothetical protein